MYSGDFVAFRKCGVLVEVVLHEQVAARVALEVVHNGVVRLGDQSAVLYCEVDHRSHSISMCVVDATLLLSSTMKLTKPHNKFITFVDCE